MSGTPKKVVRDLRRGIRAPYGVAAKLELIGITDAGRGCSVRTVDANEWGLAVLAPQPLPLAATLVRFTAPDGAEIAVVGWIVRCFPVGDQWGVGIGFEEIEPRLSPARIDIANYGR